MSQSEPLERLIKSFGKLPGIGRRSAERMAMKIARNAKELVPEMVDALHAVAEHVCFCKLCGNLTSRERDPCLLCTDARRNDKVICVVESPSDIATIEKAGGFGGRYHALMGKLSPMKGGGIKSLRLDLLHERIKDMGVDEVILALDSDVEGDATASFLAESLATAHVKITRLAFGLPAGSGISYSDPVTLSRALRGRQPLN